jgi:thiamine-phosphate pyrophosphorylase
MNLNRIIDANLNRLKEGIRVVEDIQRYIYNDKENASALKEIRHKCFVVNYEALLKARDVANDPLKATTKSEAFRKDIMQIKIANIKRAQESARVLEEILKLIDIKEAQRFKEIRYLLYEIETNISF